MITGDNPLAAVNVTTDVEIMENFPVNPDEPLDLTLFNKYDVLIAGAALKQYETRPEAWNHLFQNTWVYARVSPRFNQPPSPVPAAITHLCPDVVAVFYTSERGTSEVDRVSSLRQAEGSITSRDSHRYRDDPSAPRPSVKFIKNPQHNMANPETNPHLETPHKFKTPCQALIN